MTQICTVPSGNRIWHSENMVMGNTFGFPTMGPGKHRYSGPCLLHEESAHCSTLNPMKGPGAWKGQHCRYSSLLIMWVKPLGSPKNLCFCCCCCWFDSILIYSEKHQTSSLLPLSCWAEWANGDFTSLVKTNLLMPSGHVLLNCALLLSCRHYHSGNALKIKVGP